MLSVSVGRSGLVGTTRNVVREVQNREVTFLAASISYYTLVSLVPLLLLSVVVATFVGGEALQQQVEDLAGRYLLPAGAEVVDAALQNRGGQGSIGAASFALTVWGALKIFRGLDVAFSRVYGSETGGLLDQVRDALITLGAIGAGVVGVVVASAIIAFLPLPFVSIVSPILLTVLLCAAFFPLYYMLPDADLTVREALPGTVFSAVGWTVLSAVFGVYATIAGGSVASAFGAILLLVTWFYFSGIMLLTGAVINAVVGNRLPDGSRQLQQAGERYDVPTNMSDEQDYEERAREDRSSADRRPGREERDYQEREPRGAPDISELEAQVEDLRADLDAVEADVTERTVERPQLEDELKRYVRSRMRRGRARGWGPYLVLLYGTVMTLGAFYFLEGLVAIAAMLILFLSTLGLYVLFLVVGVGLNAMGLPRWAIDAVRDWRR